MDVMVWFVTSGRQALVVQRHRHCSLQALPFEICNPFSYSCAASTIRSAPARDFNRFRK
jgi:hypothetical protein